LLARKLATGKLATPSSRRGWIETQQLHLLPVFGDCYVDAIERLDIEEWKAAQAQSVVSRHGGAPTRIPSGNSAGSSSTICPF